MHYNMINEAMNLKAVETPQVGMVGTLFCGSDRYAIVCTEVLSKKRVRVRYMENADYTLVEANDLKFLPEDRLFSPRYFEGDFSPESSIIGEMKPLGKVYTLRKNQRWMQEGASLWSAGAVHFGHAEEYRDPSF